MGGARRPGVDAAQARLAAAALLLAAALVAVYTISGRPAGEEGGGGGRGLYVAYAPCLRPEARQALEAAASGLGVRLEPLSPEAVLREPPAVYVGDAAACRVRPLAQAVAAVLESGGAVILVGTPRQVSWVFKNETRVVMAYPLPYTNSTIVYALRVAGYRWEIVTLPTTVTTVRMAVPEVKYAKGVNPEAFRTVLRVALSWLNATVAGRGQ